MSPPFRWAAAFLLAAVPTAGCRGTKVAQPEPPDVTALANAYRAPTAPLEGHEVEAVEALEGRLTAGGRLCGWSGAEDLLCAGATDCPLHGCAGLSEVFDLLEALDGLGGADGGGVSADAGGMPSDGGAPALAGIVLTGEGFIRLRRICPGRESPPVADEANGSIELVAVFSDEGVGPLFWGDLRDCELPVADRFLRLDGGVRILLGDTPWSPADGFSPVLQVEGSGTVGPDTTALSADLRIDVAQGEVSISLAVGGDHLFFFARAGGAGFRAADGEWSCDFGTRTCDDGGGRALSW